mgnify:CR=1 FL=1
MEKKGSNVKSNNKHIQYSVWNDPNAEAFQNFSPSSRWLIDDPIKVFQIGTPFSVVRIWVTGHPREEEYGNVLIKTREVTYGDWQINE